MTSSLRLKSVRISIDLLHKMITEGWEAGTDTIVRCTEGLPEGAVFEYATRSDPAYSEPAYSEPAYMALVFSHPDWPELNTGQDIPVFEVVFSRVQREEV